MNFAKFKKIWYVHFIVDIFLFSFIEFFLLKSDLMTVNKMLIPIRV